MTISGDKKFEFLNDPGLDSSKTWELGLYFLLYVVVLLINV